MDDDDSLVVRCGRCGRRVRVALGELLGLRTFDCRRCGRASDEKNQPLVAPPEKKIRPESDAETDEILAEALVDFSQDERSILIRKAAGFSDRELNEIYGRSLTELEELVKRLVDRVRSIRHRPTDAGDT